MANSAPGGASNYNTKIIEEFRANEGRVGGPWAGTPMILILGLRPAASRYASGIRAQVRSPSASLRSWGLDHRGYKQKTGTGALANLVDHLCDLNDCLGGRGVIPGSERPGRWPRITVHAPELAAVTRIPDLAPGFGASGGEDTSVTPRALSALSRRALPAGPRRTGPRG